MLLQNDIKAFLEAAYLNTLKISMKENKKCLKSNWNKKKLE